jgi:methylated-DNA-[protein]-cysteine S-methyltransferase
MAAAHSSADRSDVANHQRMLEDVVLRIDRWLADPRTVPAELPTGPPFHRTCWMAACSIAPGATATYAMLAAMAGRPAAARAAAQAMARNRLAPLVPCHRVVASSGLGGFMGKGASAGDAAWALRLKRWLLAREGAPAAR